MVSSPADNQTIAACGTQALLCEASIRLTRLSPHLTHLWHESTGELLQAATHVVMVDDDQIPLGCLAVATLLPHLLAAVAPDAASEPLNLPDLSLGEWARDRLESIQCVPTHLSIMEFWAHVQTLPAAQLPLHWGLINPKTEQFEGLVNLPQVLRLMSQGVPTTGIRSLNPALSILDAIQQLPFPLMVRTATGAIVTQNQAWQVQLAQFFDPQALTQAAIALLDHPQTHSQHSTSPTLQGAYCQPGFAPNSCLCTCPTEDGQLRIWKFLLQPLPLEPPLPIPDPAAQAHFEWKAAPYSLVMAVDMTDSHHLIQNLQAQVAHLTIANHLKNDFLAEISHDIKNPLTAIVGLSHVLNHHGLGELPQRQAHYVQLIEQKSQQLMGIVNNLLDLHRIQTQSLVLTPEVTQVRSVCEQAVAQAIAMSAVDNNHLEQDLPAINLDIAPQIDSIVADGQRLQQILVHLLVHALSVAQAAESVELTVQPWGGWIGFTVRNPEVHIPQEQHHLMFQLPQVWGEVQHQDPQAGLHLVLAQRLAQLHGGELSFVAARELGDQLTVLIPPVLTTDPEEQAAAIAPLSEHLVLVIATYPNLLAKLHRHLAELGYQMVVARSGAEALEKVQHLQPQAILLHLPLPLVSGWDVLTLLQHHTTAQHCPIMVLGEPTQQAQAQQRGVEQFLSLPLSSQQLSQQLATAFAKRPSFASSPTAAASLPVNSSALDESPEATMLAPRQSILNLTVLHWESLTDTAATTVPWTQVGQRLHLQGCRVITTDSVEEAALLARIWKPKVVLYTRLTAEALQEIELDSPLLDLPFVVLHPAVAAIGRQIPQLTVYGCSLFSEAQVSTIEADMAILTQILKVAAGVD